MGLVLHCFERRRFLYTHIENNRSEIRIAAGPDTRTGHFFTTEPNRGLLPEDFDVLTRLIGLIKSIYIMCNHSIHRQAIVKVVFIPAHGCGSSGFRCV